MTPFFRILFGDDDVTARANVGSASLTVTDGVGSSSDTIQFVFSNDRGIITPPKTGVQVRAIGGYRQGETRDFGLFTVDSVQLSGWPQIITVNAQSIAAVSPIKGQRSTSYGPKNFPTYGDVFREIAKRNDLAPVIAPDLAAKPLRYEAQTEESDLAFLTRTARKIGGVATFKSGRLVVVRPGVGLAVGGSRLPPIIVQPGVNVLSYSVDIADRAKFGKVRATWFDRDDVETYEAEATSFGDGPDFLIRGPFASETEAQDAADEKAADLRRAIGTATFEIAGAPSAMAEADVLVYGIGPYVDGKWRATSVTNSFSADGPYTTSIECEAPDIGPTSIQPALPDLERVPVPMPRPQ